MSKNDIKTKQICALFFCLLPLTKIVCAPSAISRVYKEKLWQPLVIWFALEILFLLYVFFLIKKHGNKTFFAILKDGYGETTAKIVYFLFGLFFLVKSFLPLIEHKMLIETAFYEILPSSPVFYPLFLVTTYISLKGLKSLGRAAEFCLPICWAGLAVILFLSAPSGDPENLLPLFSGSKSGAISLLSTFSWFGDALYLLFFMGHFDLEKHDRLKLVFSYAIPAVFVVAFFCCFYAVFAAVAPTQPIAVKETGIFSVTLQNVGRFDYLAVFLITLASVLSVAFPIVTSVKLFERAFSAKNATIPALVVNILLFIATCFFSQKFENILGVYMKYLSPIFVIFTFIIPISGLRSSSNEKLQPR